jgi:hypothetical protein
MLNELWRSVTQNRMIQLTSVYLLQKLNVASVHPAVFNLGYVKTFHIKQNETQELLEPARILALTKIRPRNEVVAYLKQAQSSH